MAKAEPGVSMDLAGPWGFYETFRRAHGLQHLPKAAVPEIAIATGATPIAGGYSGGYNGTFTVATPSGNTFTELLSATSLAASVAPRAMPIATTPCR